MISLALDIISFLFMSHAVSAKNKEEEEKKFEKKKIQENHVASLNNPEGTKVQNSFRQMAVPLITIDREIKKKIN